MESDSQNYLVLGIIFLHGYLISRLIDKQNIASIFVSKLIHLCKGNLFSILLFFVFLSAFFSSFIPNMLTVLTFLPVINELKGEFALHEQEKMSLPILLAIVYGANIGGMTTLIGSPANAMLLAHFEYLKVNPKNAINFYNWITSAFPIVFIFCIIAWLVLSIVFFRWAKDFPKAHFAFLKHVHSEKTARRISLLLCFFTLSFWTFISYIRFEHKQYYTITTIISIIYGILFIIILFFVPVNKMSDKKSLLNLKDCFTGFPKKSIVFLVLLSVVTITIYWVKIPIWIAENMQNMINTQYPLFGYLVIISLVVIFSTEIFSNTAVAIAFFPVALAVSKMFNVNPVALLAIVGHSSICAFMSPIATPANAVAFGTIVEHQYKKMFLSGFLLNLFGALWLSYSLPIFFNF